MTQQTDLATMFLLAGEGVKISYYINEDNSSELDYHDAKGSLTFQSNQLHIQHSAIGTLITATLKSTADAGAQHVPWCCLMSSLEDKQSSR